MRVQRELSACPTCHGNGSCTPACRSTLSRPAGPERPQGPAPVHRPVVGGQRPTQCYAYDVRLDPARPRLRTTHLAKLHGPIGLMQPRGVPGIAAPTNRLPRLQIELVQAEVRAVARVRVVAAFAPRKPLEPHTVRTNGLAHVPTMDPTVALPGSTALRCWGWNHES
jgi:hypothetical protein